MNIERVFRCSIFVFGFVCCLVGSFSLTAYGQDSYEDDDTYDQSSVIVLSAEDDGTYTQSHTFHHADDIDWVKFYAVAGETYAIKVFNLNQTNPYVELFGMDGQTSIKLQNTGGVFDAEETLDWTCPEDGDGIYYARVGEYFPVNYDPAATYDIVMYQPTLLGLPVDFLTGTVLNNFNQVVQGASIVLSGANGSGAAISFGNGGFVANAATGSYSVNVTAPGHNGWAGSANVPGNITVVLTRSYNTNPEALPDEFPVKRGGTVSGNVLTNDTDGDGDPLTAVLDSNVTSGTLQFNSNGSFTYTHNGQGGDDSFTYHATDSVGNSTSVTVTLSLGLKNLTFIMLLLNNK